MTNRSSGTTVFIYLASALVVLVSVYPFVYAISTSLKTGTALFNTQIIPDQADLRNYAALFEGVQPFGKSLVNSVMVAVMTVGFAMLIGVTAAYALGRIRFKGKGLLLLCILGVSMFPQVAVLSGMFELIQWLGIYNKAWGLVLPYTIFTLPFTVWILTTFMRELPGELEEAAIMDGCGPLRIIFQVFLPLLWPALVSTGLTTPDPVTLQRAFKRFADDGFTAGQPEYVFQVPLAGRTETDLLVYSTATSFPDLPVGTAVTSSRKISGSASACCLRPSRRWRCLRSSRSAHWR